MLPKHTLVKLTILPILDFGDAIYKIASNTLLNNILWSDDTKIELFCLNDNASRLEETWHYPYSAKYREILHENLLQSAQDLRLGCLTCEV